MAAMVSNEEIKQTILQLLGRFDVDQVLEIENEMSLGDKISLYYLLNDDPEETLRNVKTKSNNLIVGDWCQARRNHDEWKLRLIESLIIMQNFKTLKRLGYKKRNLAEVNDLLECAKRSYEFDIRKALYKTVDSITEDELSMLIDKIDNGKTYQEPTDLYKSIYIEIYLLEWQIRGEINLETNSLKNLAELLNSLNLTPACHTLQNCITNLECDEEENDLETNFDVHPSNDGNVTNSSMSMNLDSPADYIYPILNPDCVGLCVVVNQENYAPTSQFDKRNGSSYDAKQLEFTMALLNIRCFVLNDLHSNQLFPTIECVIRKHFKKEVHSLLFVVIMAHGGKGSVTGVDGMSVDTDCIRESLSNENLPCLKDKPKIIIFQSCRGSYHYIKSANNLVADGFQEPPPSPFKSYMDHYMICWSTIPGCQSYRNIFEGSLYIQKLCKCLKELHKCKDLHSIMTIVHRDFYKDSESLLVNDIQVSMLPEVSTSLMGRIYLHKM